MALHLLPEQLSVAHLRERGRCRRLPTICSQILFQNVSRRRSLSAAAGGLCAGSRDAIPSGGRLLWEQQKGTAFPCMFYIPRCTVARNTFFPLPSTFGSRETDRKQSDKLRNDVARQPGARYCSPRTATTDLHVKPSMSVARPGGKGENRVPILDATALRRRRTVTPPEVFLSPWFFSKPKIKQSCPLGSKKKSIPQSLNRYQTGPGTKYGVRLVVAPRSSSGTFPPPLKADARSS